MGLCRIWHHHPQRLLFTPALGGRLPGAGAIDYACCVGSIVFDPSCQPQIFSFHAFRCCREAGERTMKLVVLGATGGTGLEIVRQAVERGHSVTAFVRSPERLSPFAGRITVRQGDLLSSSALEQVLKDQDAVLSAFGPRVPIVKTEENLLRDFAAALTPAMLRA